MKKIIYLLLTVVIFNSCKNVNKNNLKTSVKQPQATNFEQEVRTFYSLTQKNNKNALLDYISDNVLSITIFEATYQINFVDKNKIAENLYFPSYDQKLEVKNEVFPELNEDGQWTKEGIFIEKVKENPMKEILNMSPNKTDKEKIINLGKQIEYRVLNTQDNTITYWSNENGKWQIVAVEFIESNI